MDSMLAAIVGFAMTQNRGAQQEFSVSIKSQKMYHFNTRELGLLT